MLSFEKSREGDCKSLDLYQKALVVLGVLRFGLELYKTLRDDTKK